MTPNHQQAAEGVQEVREGIGGGEMSVDGMLDSVMNDHPNEPKAADGVSREEDVCYCEEFADPMCPVCFPVLPKPSAEQVAPPAASPEPVRNQCDGCNLGLPLDAKGNHLRDGAVFGIHMACTKDKYAEQAPVDGGTEELLADFVLAFGNKYSPSRDDVRFQDAINMSEEVYASERVHNFSAAHRKSLIAGLSCLLKTAPPVDPGPDPRVEEIRKRLPSESWYHCQAFQRVDDVRTIHGVVKSQRVDFVATVHKRIVIPMQGREANISSKDMAFIAAAPDDIRYLLSELDRLKGER